MNPFGVADAGGGASASADSDDKQLLRLTICQALQSQYVMEHTRGIDRFLSAKIEKDGDDAKGDEEKSGGDTAKEKENSLTTLVDTALTESKSRHLTAGFRSVWGKNKLDSTQSKENNFKFVVDRLGRELSAIGLSADLSYLSLTNKRSIILNKIVLEYQKEFRLKGMALLTRKTLPDASHSLLKITVNSGVFFMLTMLESASITNAPLCIKILNFLQAQLSNIKPMELETSLNLPLPAIAENAFDSVSTTLFSIASNAAVHKLIRYKCLELLLMLSVSRATLSILLYVVYLLLFEFNGSAQAKDIFTKHILLNGITEFRKMKRMIRLDLPNRQNQMLRASILNVCDNVSHCSMTTDGQYLFIHSNKGLSKIGTGINNTSPGSLILQHAKYRSSEKSSIACINNRLYYRSANIAKSCEAIVISTDTLKEIGHVKRDGKGTVATADNSHVWFGVKMSDEQKRAESRTDAGDDDDDEKRDDNDPSNVDVVRARLRTIQNQIARLENAGVYEGAEIEDLEMEYEDLFNSLPDEIQDMIDDLDSMSDGGGGGDLFALQAATATATAVAHRDSAEKKKSKKDKKKSKIPLFNPLISDGRFLYAVVPEKPLKRNVDDKTSNATNADGGGGGADKDKDDNEEEEEISHIYIRVNAFDPNNNLEHCNTVLLKRPLPSDNTEVVLDFNPSSEKRKENLKAGGSTNPYDPYYNPYGRRAGGDSKYGTVNTSCIDLGNAEHLNFAGSLTIECWFKFEDDEMKRIPQELIYHGDGNYWTYIYVQNTTLYAGCNTPLGSTKGYCSINQSQVDVKEWTHLAVTFDATDGHWRIYLNGVHSNPNQRASNVRAGPQKTKAPWIVGSVPTKPFFGKICEVRLWSVARQEEQIKKYMKIEGDGNVHLLKDVVQDHNLRGYWPCNDGVGLLCADVSKYRQYGFIKDATWQMGEKRPFKCSYTKLKIGDGDADKKGTTVGATAAGGGGVEDAAERKKSDDDETSTAADKKLTASPKSAAGGGSGGASPRVGGDSKSAANKGGDGNGGNNEDISKTEGLINNKRYVLQPFEKSTCSKAIFYTNGEILVIAYPSHAFWNKSYRGVAQKFELTNNGGLLTDEIEYDDFGKVLCATFVNDWKSMWVYNKSSPYASCHSMAAPTTISRWRQQRMKYEQETSSKDTLTVKQLAGKYMFGLKHIDYFEDEDDDDGQEQQKQKTNFARLQTLKRRKEEVDQQEALGNITNLKALANILIKLDEDTESLRTVDMNEKMPLSLSLPFGVDLTSKTFELLLEIAEKLSAEFYAETANANSNANANAAENDGDDIEATNTVKVRMLALLISVRLLKTNINHLITWNVDPMSVGFNDKKKDELGVAIADSKTIRQRYVELLNTLVFQRPSMQISKLIENDIHSDCSECLSIGLSVFFQDPLDRVNILVEHVENLLIESNPLRLLLASRYFNSLTKPHNLIALVPAIKRQVAGIKAEEIQNNRQRYLLLLSPILQLVYNNCKKELYAYLQDPQKFLADKEARNDKSSKTRDADQDKSDEDENNLIGTLRMFLTRISVCLFADIDEFILENYTFPYCFSLMNMCTELLAYSNQQCTAKKFKLAEKAYIVNIFRYKIGELLAPLLTCIWSLNLDSNLSLCSKILPTVYKFMKILNTFIADLPDCISAETEFINSNFNRITVKRDANYESPHPVPRGFTEKHIYIPGAKSLKLTIDKQTFENGQNNVGCSLAFYKKAGHNQLITSFTSQPSKSVHINSDSVYVVFSSGYNSNAWGFKIAVNAKIEEVQFDLPWIFDLAKNAAIISSKCIGAFIASNIKIKQLFKDGLLKQTKRNDAAALKSMAASDTTDEAQKKKTADSASSSRRNLKKKHKNKKGKQNADSSKQKEKERQKENEFIKSILSLPRVEHKWLSSDLLSSGVLFEADNNSKELQYISSIVPDKDEFGVQSEIDAKDDTENELDESVEDTQLSYDAIVEIANKIYPLLTNVRCQRIPIKDIPELVQKSSAHVFAALLLHNNLLSMAQRVIAEKITDHTKIPESIVRVYKTSQKNFSQWLLQKFQIEYATKQQALQKKKEEEQRKKEEKKKKKRKGKEKRPSVLSATEFKAAFGIADSMVADAGAGAGADEQKTDLPVPAGMMGELDEHGLPMQEEKEEKKSGHDADVEDNDDDEKKGDADDEDGPKGDGARYSADEDEDDRGGGVSGVGGGSKGDAMDKMLMKKKQMAMGGDAPPREDNKNKKTKDSQKKKSAFDADSDAAAAPSAANDAKQLDKDRLLQQQKTATMSSAATASENASKSQSPSKGGDKSNKNNNGGNNKEKKEDKKWEVNKTELYSHICADIIGRCKFLLSVLSVQSVMLAQPALTRNKSTDKAAVKSSGDKDKTAALAAWQYMQSNDLVTLKYASPEQRPSIVWRFVLSFLDEKEIDCDLMINRIKFDRIKSRLRAYGLNALSYFLDLECTKSSIVRRELLHFLIPSLYAIHDDAFGGKPINISNGLTPIGEKLTKNLNLSLKHLMQLLKAFMMKPTEIGSNLIKCILYCFSFSYDVSELSMMINEVNLFESIKTLLNQSNVSKSIGFKTAAWSTMEMLTNLVGMLKNRQYAQTSSNLAIFDDFLREVYTLQIEQLNDIAQIQHVVMHNYVPQLPRKADMNLRSVVQSSKEDEDEEDADGEHEDGFDDEDGDTTTRTTFGITSQLSKPTPGAVSANVDEAAKEEKANDKKPNADAAPKTKAAEPASKDKHSDREQEAFNVRVLSFMLNSLSQTDNATQMELFCSEKALNALLKLSFESPSPRTRNVSLRLLRQLLLNEKLVKIDMSQFVQQLLSNIGQSLLSPMIASYFIPKPNANANANAMMNGVPEMMDAKDDNEADATESTAENESFVQYLTTLKLPQLYSTDGCCIMSEQIMILRYLVRMSKSWSAIISDIIKQYIVANVAFAPSLEFNQKTTQEQNGFIFKLFGCLGVFGGYIDTVRVGAKCYYIPENITATVTSRSFSKNRVSLIRDNEQTHIDKVAIHEIVCIGDELFDANLYAFKEAEYVTLMQNLVNILQKFTEPPPEPNAAVPAKVANAMTGARQQGNILLYRLYYICCSCLSSMLLNKSLLNLYVSKFDISSLTSIAFTRTDEKFKENKLPFPTSILNDKSFIISSILLNRCRRYEAIRIELSHSAKTVKVCIKKPSIEFKAEFVKFGKKLQQKKQGIAGLAQSSKGKLDGSLAYLKLYETVTPQKVSNKIVCVDTYDKMSKLKERLAQIKQYGAIAVVLLLHSKNVKAEGLDPNDDDDDLSDDDEDDDDDDDERPSGKRKKNRKKRRSATQRNIVDMAGASALNSIGAQMALRGMSGSGVPIGVYGDDPFFNGAGGMEDISQVFSFGGRGQPLNAARGNPLPDMDGGGLQRQSSSESVYDEDGNKKKTKKEIEKEKQNDKIIKGLHIMAVNVETAHIIHLLSGIQAHEYPQQLYYNKIIDKLVDKGHDRDLAVRALQKNSKITVEAADKWITQNQDWLMADIKAKQQQRLKLEQGTNASAAAAADGGTADGSSGDGYIRLNKDDILKNADTLDNSWKLADRWNKFDDSGLRDLSVTNVIGNNSRMNDVSDASVGGGQGSLNPSICDNAWYDSTFYQPTHYLLSHLLSVDYGSCIHYARRALLSIFMHNDAKFKLSEKIPSKPQLLTIFNICLSYQLNAAAELNPIETYQSSSLLRVSQQIIRMLNNDDANKNIYCNLLLSFSSNLLLNFRSSTTMNAVSKNEAKVQTIIAAVHGRWETNRPNRGGFAAGTATQPSTQAQFFRFSNSESDQMDEKKQFEEDEESNDISLNIKKMKSTRDMRRKLKLIVRSDPTLCNMGTTYVTIFSDKKCKNLIAQFTVIAFDNSTNVCVVNASSFYYTVLSSSWYQGAPPSNVLITVVDITSNHFKHLSEDNLLNGSMMTCLTYIQSILQSIENKEKDAHLEFVPLDLDLILLQLLRCLEFTTSIEESQTISRVATSIFNEWNHLKHADDDVVKLITECVQHLEVSHEELRTETITRWSSGTFPGPHVQCLLELLLSAQQALHIGAVAAVAAAKGGGGNNGNNGNNNNNRNEENGSSTKDKNKDSGNEAVQNDDELRALHNEYYTKYRNGSSKVSIISLSKETLCKSNTLTVTRDAQNRYMIDDFVADCCVSGGGKWYFEVTFVGQCQYCCIGFIGRKYRKTSNTGISNDYEGHSWSIVGPNTQYMHRSKNNLPQTRSTSASDKDKKNGRETADDDDEADDDDDESMIGIASWAPNSTVAVLLNLDDNTMEFVFEGRSTGIAFNGFSKTTQGNDANLDDGLYPTVSLNQNTSVVINLGAKPFKYIQKFPGYVGFESPKYCTTSSWLNRYNLASDVTYYLSNKLDLPDTIIEACLNNEVSLDYSHEMRFEIVKTNAMATPLIDSIFKDDSTLFNSNKPSGTNVCFKVSGYQPVEFVLTGMTIRCSTTSNGFRVMVFISNNDSEPDFDQYNWCGHWTEQQYKQYFKNKSYDDYVRKPHEPIAFLTTNSSTCHVKLPNPVRGKFITLKVIANVVHNGLHIEYIKFDCIHGKHPLSDLMGKNQKDAAVVKRSEIITELNKYINSLNETEGDMDGDAAGAIDAILIDNESLTEMSQIIANRLSVSVSSLDCVMLEPTKEELKRFKFQDTNIRALQARFALIKYLNRLVTPLLHYIDITLFYSKSENKSETGHKQQAALQQSMSSKKITKSLSAQVHELKGCYFMSTKKSVFDVLLASTATSGSSSTRNAFNSNVESRPRITINRILASRAKQSGTDTTGKHSIFGQLFEGLRNYRWSMFKTNKKGEQLWNVQFSGEGSIDVGGPYRESLTYAIQDLQSSATPLFILCPNGKNSVGLNREKWIPNPSCTSSLYLQMYEFVGVLMGIALRTKQTLAFDFPALVYKQLLTGPNNLTLDISDLEAIDKLCVQALNEIKNIDETNFEYIVYEAFTTSLSNGSIVELCENGKNIDVTYKNSEQFISLVIKKRLSECAKQLEHIKRGLNLICQQRILSLFTWYDLERMICGDPNMDVEVLRKHTNYQGGISSTSTVVKHFWNTMHSFTQYERQLFLRFVWGRNRLPATANDWGQETFTIKALNTSPDSLPIAHTCFFSIDLPPYKTFKLCRAKILYAINNCQAIDVDFNPNSSSLQAWIDDL